LVRITSLLALLTILAVTIATYFSALSQYPTADQTNTSERLHRFLSNPRSIVPADGSLLSDLVVAVPGHLISKALGSVYDLNSPIVWTLHSTPLLPFAIAQVLIALVLIVFMTKLFVDLTAPEKPDALVLLFTLLVVLNFPMLKALCKVLKYDALSTALSAIAVLLYIGYRKFNTRPPATFFGRYCTAAMGICCGMAYLEKDTTHVVALLILIFELAAIPLISTDRRSALRQALRFLTSFLGCFLLTTIVLVPKVWFDPRSFGELFANLHLYFVNLPKTAGAVVAAVVATLYWIGPAARIDRNWHAILFGYLCVSGTIVFVLAGAALWFQDNIIFDPLNPGNNLDIEQLRAQSIHISKPMANTAMTTLDHSALVQYAKLLFSMVRSIVYTLPEITVLMVVAAAPLFLFLSRRRPALLASDGGALALLSIFPTVLMAGLALAEMPLDPKYLVLVNLLLTLYALYATLLAFREMPPAAANIAKVAICVLTIVSVLPSGPTYLGYKNLFRDRDVDNAAALDMDRYIWWMWAGWGETAYAIGRYLEGHRPAIVAYDYLPPFYSVPGLTWTPADFVSCQSEKALEAALTKMKEASAEYLIISKNKSNRNWCENQILRRTRERAVFVDVRQGFEWGWLFRVSDVGAAIGNGVLKAN
jgi:hypothetical protein